MYDEDDYEDERLEQRSQTLQKQLRERARSEFIQGCYAAYDILQKDGSDALKTGELDSICRAINRMMSLFLAKEEYEKCHFLKNFVLEHLPGHEIEPDPNVLQNLQI